MGKKHEKKTNPPQQIIQSVQPQQIIQSVQPNTFTIIDTITYNNLLNENVILKAEINKLQENYINELSKKNQTIDELRKENAELKKEIEILKNKVFELERRLDNNEANTLFYKFIIAIQDINRNDQLEKSIHDISVIKKLKKRRQSRNDLNHYIYEDEDELIEIDYKKFILYNKLLNITTNIKNKFNKKYPNLISHIIKYIAPNIKMNVDDFKDVSQETKEEIEEWWNPE